MADVPRIDRHPCGDTWAHYQHIDRRTGVEFLCDGYSKALASPKGHALFMSTKQVDQFPSPDDVNAQHLAAMGLADVPLGTSIEPGSDTAKRVHGATARCQHISVGASGQVQCARQPGHEGKHARGQVTWTGWDEQDETEPQAEVFTRSCDDAKTQVLHDAHDYQVGEITHHCPGLYDGVARNAPTKTREGDQALPKPGQECVQDLIIAEMQESKRVGVERYGSTLQTFNGRRSFQDLAEEARDFHVYAAQIKAEAEADRQTLVGVVAEALREDMFPGETQDFGETLPMAEVAVDAIMGWVVGQDQARRFRDGQDIYDTLMRGGWGKHTTYDDLTGAERNLVEAQTHAVMDRLGIESEYDR